MQRLFFALQPTAEWGEELLRTAAPVLEELQAVAVPLANLHATLSFVGAVAPERLADLRAAAGEVRGVPVSIHFDRFEYWEVPRVLVAGSSVQPEEAMRLSQALHQAAIAAGFASDAKPFRAHLTLARKIAPTRAQSVAWPREISPGFVVRCEKFALMESRRGEQGSIYSVLDEWPLYGKKPG